jgi:gliding-associated putative ABC transporter substrate-binding component GldG
LKFGANNILAAILLLAILMLVYWFAAQTNARLDLTRNHIYTISPYTNKLLANLKDKVTVTVYASEKDTPPEVTEKRSQLRELLTEYRKRSNGKVQFTFKDPSSDPKIEQEAKQARMEPQLMQQASVNDFRVQQGYLGFSVDYKGKNEPVPYLNSGSSLEYSLTSAINKVAQVDTPTIGLMVPQGNPMMGEQSPYSILQQLLQKEGFVVKSLTATDLSDLKDVKMLMVMDPKELSEEALYRIDQFVMGGGKLLVAAPGVELSQQMGSPNVTPKVTNLNSLLEHYGLKIEQNLVEDWKNGIQQPKITQSGMLVRFRNPLLIVTPALNKSDIITKNLKALLFAYTSSVGRSDHGTSGSVEVLASTSNQSRVQSDSFNLEASSLKPPSEDEKLTPQDLIVSVKGVLDSRFEDTSAPVLTKTDGTTYTVASADIKKQSPPTAQVIVCGDALMFTDQALQNSRENAFFPINAAEALTRDDGGILALRGNDQDSPVLKSVTPRQALITQILIIVGIPALLILFGLLKMLLNRRRRAHYREVYGKPRKA